MMGQHANSMMSKKDSSVLSRGLRHREAGKQATTTQGGNQRRPDIRTEKAGFREENGTVGFPRGELLRT